MQSQLLPANWQLANLGEISSDISYGYTASATSEPTGVKLLRITDIQNNTVNWPNVPNCKIEPEKVGKYRLKPSDLVFARTGATVGKSYLLKGEIPESVYASYLIRVRCLEGVSIEFLANYFQSPYYWRQITDFSAGIGQPNVNGTKLKNLSVPVPPLAEQKVIADKLDTLLAQVENTKARLERVPQILKRFRQSVLAAAVSGRLIDAQPESIAKLEELVDTENGARKPVSATIRKTIQGTIPYYGATGIVDYLNDYTHEGRYLLVGEDGANLLSKSKDLAFIVEGKMWVNNHAHVLKERPGVNLDFVKIAINSLDLTPWITGSAQPKLTKKSLCGLPITNFTLDEQTEIVRRVDQLFAHADRIEQQVNNALARVNNLTQSILAKAFRGELTEQWRKDNPELISGENSAEALLERIKAERAAMKPAKKSRQKRTTA
ncbi:restriction endonuclease subunit S [Vreelandella aquamarina]|uniref:restriction endonuclease subunit S n=1 Tax=Vreelandella aquamarina TaxID=77097 RepID=UPI000785F070|nr:restriction endonuclease subunit S [Halomonas axialensis]